MEVIYRNTQGIGVRDTKGGPCAQNEKYMKGLLKLMAVYWSECLFHKCYVYVWLFSGF